MVEGDVEAGIALAHRPIATVPAEDPLSTGVLQRLDPTGLDATAAVLAARCATRLAAVADAGGPDARDHLEQLRRLLIRREGRASRARRSQIARALVAAGTGRPGAIAEPDRVALVRDLRDIDRALLQAVRVGRGSTDAA